jgi:Bacterial regulatory protein, arsR family
MTAGEIVERFAEMMSQPAISKHLSVLENAGLVWRKSPTPVKQLALSRLWLGFELRPPVAKSLGRDAFRLAILPLIQVAALPRLVVRPPESLTLTRP